VPDHPRNIVGPQLRRLRTEEGLSQAALAAKCQRFGWDVSRDILKHIESGARWVSDMELILLAACLGVEMEALLPHNAQAVKLALSRLGGGAH
jgi:transcriptional regulator with XRE-family HTH domain